MNSFVALTTLSTSAAISSGAAASHSSNVAWKEVNAASICSGVASPLSSSGADAADASLTAARDSQ